MAAFTSSSEQVIESIKKQYQRDVNCLADPDRMTRRRALTRIENAFFGRKSTDASSASHETKALFLEQVLLQPLLTCFNDPVEKCREISITLVQKFTVELAKEESEVCVGVLLRLAPQVWKAASTRVSSTTIIEPSEELRCQLLELVSELVSLAKQLSKHESMRLEYVQNVQEQMDVLTQITVKGMPDNFPDSKIACATLVSALCQVCPQAVSLHYGEILKAIVSNMGHQRSKVRQATLDGIKNLVLFGGGFSSEGSEKLMAEIVLPFVKRVGSDRSAAVRKNGVEMISLWLNQILADDSLELQEFALITLEQVAQTQQLDNGDDVVMVEVLHTDLPEPFNSPMSIEKGYPSAKARAMVCAVLPQALPEILKDLEDWTTTNRFRAVKILRNVLVFGGSNVTSHLPSIVSGLCLSITDEESEVLEVAMECAELIGRFVDTSATLEVILPRAMGKSISIVAGSAATSGREKQGALAVLCAVVRGFHMDDESMVASKREHLVKVLETLNDENIRDCEEEQIQQLCLQICDVIILKLIDACKVQKNVSEYSTGTAVELHYLTRVLLQLCGAAATDELKQEANDLIQLRLAILVDASIIERFHETIDDEDELPIARKITDKLFAVHASHLMGAIVGESKFANVNELIKMASEKSLGNHLMKVAELSTTDFNTTSALFDHWTKYSSNRVQFDQLVSQAGTIQLGKAGVLQVALGVIFATTRQDMDPDLRLCMLALLETMLQSEKHCHINGVMDEALKVEFHSLIQPFTSSIIIGILKPHLVWKVGRVASTMRKVSVYCFRTLLKARVVDFGWLHAHLGNDLMPSLRTCLDDGDADTRRYMCNVIAECFSCYIENLSPTGAQLDCEMVRTSYHDFVKRMDDASDSVRLAACELLTNLVCSAPKESLVGTPIDYIVDTLMIHLDDGEENIRNAVYQVLAAIARCIDPKLVGKRASDERGKHRDPALCDQLVELCKSI